MGLFSWITLAQLTSLSGTALDSTHSPLLSQQDMGSSGKLVGKKEACPSESG